MSVSPADIRRLALALPGATEGTWYGKPAFLVAGKGFARLHEDGESVVGRISMVDRDFLLQANPKAYYITEHYRNHPAVLARRHHLSRKEAGQFLQNAWRFVAPKRLTRAGVPLAVKPRAKPTAPTWSWLSGRLRRMHGAPAPAVSQDPFALILYEQVAYLATDAKRRQAFARLDAEVGLDPRDILNAPVAQLRRIARAGGSIGVALRADRMRQSARLVMDRWEGSLGNALTLPIAQARKALTAFPMIGAPAADRILAVTGAHKVLGIDSNGLRVLLRVGWGTEGKNYAATYRSVIEALEPVKSGPAELADVAALLHRHGQTICRAARPACGDCALAARCRYARTLDG